MPRKFAILLFVLVAVAVAGVAAATTRGPARTTPAPPVGLYVDPYGAAPVHLRALERAGRTAEAALVRRIAVQPAATWFADDATGYVDRARRLVTSAAAARRIPVLTFYFIPHRDCGRYSAGGAADGLAYRRWVGNLAGALRGHRAIVILEPDAVAHAVRGCLNRVRAAERFALLASAVETLRSVPGVTVYLDAGNPTWLTPAEVVPALRRAGITRSHGFALNVANFETTAANLAYGIQLSRPLGGARFVVDTSRNGTGPARPGAGSRHWCNPPGRKLGTAPTLHTGHPLVAGYLWVKRPGESDGACSPGAPPAGRWFHRYALDLARQ
ncbi:glycoside hydrolase family 6 protein [Paractinoplanes rishiriensis]|uniref:Glucanase n=1 Tax=Paractinoplanes rishiriensis TaxID=1050105 RepID=A0A919JVI2_9ACTN|nr:glycoside hydrolase family 6 protein [Actinoplanes rishiriensis]GIE95971.1 glucanase [Actinoplanes rishiriensis]